MTEPQEDPTDIADLVEVYHRYGAEHHAEDFWAWDRVKQIVCSADAERAWQLVQAIVRSAPDNRLEYVGAGPVEDLVVYHGRALIDWIVGEASRDSRFQTALASIWLVEEDIASDVLRRLQQATGGRILVATQAEIDAAAGFEGRSSVDRDA
jgi:hypothetical protein